MGAKSDIVCIYCKELRAPSVTHVIGRLMGGDLTAETNCVECNGKMGTLDQALGERSPLTLSRIAETPPETFGVQLGGEVFFRDEDSGLTLELRLRNRMRPELLPQVHARPVGDEGKAEVMITAGSAEDLEALLDYVDSVVGERALRSIHIKTGPPQAGPNPRLVLHRPKTPAAYVRVQARKDQEILVGALERGWPAICAEYRAQLAAGTVATKTHEKPHLRVAMSFSLDDEYRAVARIAFDYLAARFGADVALRDELDEVRDYIRGIDIRHAAVDGEAIAYDPRFVRRGGGPGLMPTAAHSIVLFWAAGEVCAGVTLYGRNAYGVRLGRVAAPLALPAGHEFSTTRSGNRQLTLEEMVRRLRPER